MFEKIIVPLDGSETAEAALAPAFELAGKLGSQVWLLRVVPSAASHITQLSPIMEAPASAAANVDLIERMQEEEHTAATEYLNAVKARFGGKAETVIHEGDAADQISELVQAKQADLVVMSSHGRTGLSRMVFGSVADRVLKESQVPVLLIRIKHEG